MNVKGRLCARSIEGKLWRLQSHEEGFVPKMLREIVETAKSRGRFCPRNVEGKLWRLQSHEEGFVPKILREIVEIARSRGRAIFGVALGLHNLSCCGRVWPT